MKNRLFFVFLLFIPVALGAGPSADPLWQKAVEVARRNKPWVPGLAIMHIETQDDKGNPKERYDSELRLVPGADGTPELRVEKAVRDGMDVTDKERDAQEKRSSEAKTKGKPQALNFGDDPFDPDLQAAVDVTALGQSRTIGGKRCSVFGFTMKKKDGSTLEGTAALDPENGTPVEVTYTAKPLPVGVQSMTTIMRYGNGPSGDGFLREVSVDGAGAFLFIKRTFRTLFSLDGYWKRGES